MLFHTVRKFKSSTAAYISGKFDGWYCYNLPSIRKYKSYQFKTK